MQIAPAGDRAVLIDLGDVTAEELHAWNAAVQRVPGVVRTIPGHSSLYVIFRDAPDLGALAACHPERSERPGRAARIHLIPLALNGPDLPAFLHHTDQPLDALLLQLPNIRFIARYLGFRAGFAYLDGWPPEWSMPRRPTSRPVAAGSFGIAGDVAAFYPIDTPGGWNILGRTDALPPIAPGDEIRLTVVHDIHAPLATWTDKPFDDAAAALANEAAGNDPDAPVLECPLVGPRVRFMHDTVVAWCTPDLQLSVEQVRAGDERDFGRVTNGLRGYLACRAGFSPPLPGRRAEARPTSRLVIHATNGPHPHALTRVECEVTPQLDRVGIRLRPLHPLHIEIPADLKSIGMQCGTVQLHPDGSLVAMGPDHPVTGGYLQPLTVLSTERWKLAQLVPGERITFVTTQLPNS